MRVQNRRTDSFPTTYEVPFGVGLIWLLSAFLVLPLGQGVAFWLRGSGFVWPSEELVSSVWGLLAGEPGRGLPGGLRQVAPPASLVYAMAALIEVAISLSAVAGLAGWWRTVGPYAQFGMATRHEVATHLGRTQLARRRATIRPDLAQSSRR